MILTRRTFLLLLPLTAIACTKAAAQTITVHKTPWCGCCTSWVDHLRAEGFDVAVEEMENLDPVAARLGVPAELRSCHTAEVEGYAVEGHVPAADIRRLLVTRPDAAGLAVPGMPIGSPGMEQGNARDSYQVILFGRDGTARVFAEY